MKEEIETKHFEHTLRFWGRTALQSHASPNQVEVCAFHHNLSQGFYRVMSVLFIFPFLRPPMHGRRLNFSNSLFFSICGGKKGVHSSNFGRNKIVVSVFFCTYVVTIQLCASITHIIPTSSLGLYFFVRFFLCAFCSSERYQRAAA